MQAMLIEMTIALAMMATSPSERLHTHTPSAVVAATAMPFRKPAPASFHSRRGHCRSDQGA